MNLINRLKNKAFKQVSQADIILVEPKSGEHVLFPVIPSPLPIATRSQKNNMYETINGDLNLIGEVGLRTLRLDVLLPSSMDYPFIRPMADDGETILEFIDRIHQKYCPVRLCIIEGVGKTHLNMLCTIDCVDLTVEKNGDYHCSLSFTEYREIASTIDAQRRGG